MNWEQYEKVMQPLRSKAKKIPAHPPNQETKKKKEAPFTRKDLFKKIIGS